MKYFMKHSQNSEKPKGEKRRGGRIVYIYAAAVLALLVSFVVGVLMGATEVGLSDLAGLIFGGGAESPEARILLYVRLPRVAAALLCGAALSVSGVLIQGVLANGLASPSIIGVNSGAGLAVTLCAAFGIAGTWQASAFAFLGAFLAVMLVSIGAKKWGASRGSVVLMGVALNALLGAISDAVVTFSPEISVMSTDFRVGDFSSVTYAKLIPAALIITVALVISFTLSNELDVLTLGDENAKGLGLNTGVTRVIFLVLAALMAGAAVSVAGLLSFVGLLVPHAIRRTVSSQTSHLVPLSALFGGAFVALCDTCSRTLFSPYELPVGIIMAFVGAPFFVFILIRGKGGHKRA